MNQFTRNGVRSLLAAVLALPGAGALAQLQPVVPPPSAAPAAPGADRLTPSELEELLGPIALYPDPLLANVLAASVYPSEVSQAAGYVAMGGNPAGIETMPWEPSVKAVAKIPDAIKMMGQYSDWTVALGQAYLVQAKDVMDVIQSLRLKAQLNGALVTTPQQQVVVQQQVIYIQPADPQIIYVPVYSPSVVYVQPATNNDVVAAGVIGFGLGIAAGLIIANNMDCDWHGGCIGYGWHGSGWHGGNNEININGDVNIGNRNTNVVAGNNNRNNTNIGNRVGNEGNAWAPNKSKQLASSKPNQLSQFRGGATAANRAQVPGGRAAAPNAFNNRPAPAAARPAARPPVQTPPRQNVGAARSPANSAYSREMPTPPRRSSESAFSGGSGTRAESQRGTASRTQSHSRAARSAPSRSRGRGR